MYSTDGIDDIEYIIHGCYIELVSSVWLHELYCSISKINREHMVDNNNK